VEARLAHPIEERRRLQQMAHLNRAATGVHAPGNWRHLSTLLRRDSGIQE